MKGNSEFDRDHIIEGFWIYIVQGEDMLLDVEKELKRHMKYTERYNKGENMQKVRKIIIGIAGAVVISYIISAVYAKCRYSVSLSEREPSGKSVCIYEDGQYELIDVEDHIETILLGVMQDNWSDEMLKTMAVILRTGMYYQMESKNMSQAGNTNLINESELREIRYTYDELRQMWGDGYKDAVQRSRSAVLDTRGVVIRYNGKVILPVYHIVSVGHTVSAEELYGYDIPYLRQVDSDADRIAPEFSTTEMFSEDRLRKIFDRWLDKNAEEGNGKVCVLRATESGFAKTISVFGREIDAEDFCRQLGLASANVHIDRPGDDYRVITIGVGNSLGMSLYGAEILAANGESYDEIIRYYYTGVTVSK